MPSLKRRVAELEQPREDDYCAGCLKRLFAEPDGTVCPVCGAPKPAPLPISVARAILNGTR